MKKKKLTILAIETSCDETAAAIILDGQIKSNIIASQIKLHAKYGGVVPEVAAREHVAAIIPTINLALKQAKTLLKEVDYIAVTQGPGLATSLMVGVDTAQTLCMALNKPLLAVNHLEAHVYANFVGKKVLFPALVLTVSGGHTMLVYMKNHGLYQILGETLDDAAGEAFDKTAKLLGLGYPGGPKLSKLANLGNPKYFNFPRPMLDAKNLNFSFSGLKTAVLYELLKHKKITLQLKKHFCASIQQAIVDTLIGKLKHALDFVHPKTIMLGGGVAANELLRANFTKLALKNKVNYSIPKLEYCTDNAAMIGLAAFWRIKTKRAKIVQTITAEPRLKLK